MESIQAIPEWKAAVDEIWTMFKETDRIVKETAPQMKVTDKRVGEITNRFGEVVEHMIVPNLVAKFQELGFEFGKTNRGMIIRNPEHNIFTEVDAFLENGDKVMAVETKTKVKLTI